MEDATRALAESPGPATTGERGAAVTPPDSLAARSVGVPARRCAAIRRADAGLFLSGRVMR